MDNETSVVTVDKIVEKSKQWTLEGDCTLFQWMDQISRNLEERVTKTSSALNDLSIKLDRSSVALSNATNNLAALQYSQFVENRVHDDDETLANVAEVPKPSADVTDSKAVNNNIYSFLKKNLETMNSCHEAYSISYDDSDEDEPATNVVYRAKNPYEARPLPHIYGSSLWKEKWHIGLCDSDNDFSGDENSEQFSESSSTADDSYESTAPTMSEWDSTAWGLNTNHLVERKETHTPSIDEESSNQGESCSQSDVSTPKAQGNLPAVQMIQEQRYYQHVPRREERADLFDDIFADRQQPVVSQAVAPLPKKISHETLISNEPPPDVPAVENDSNRRVGAKKPLNLFDDDEFSSFMDQIVQTANNKNVRANNLPEESLEPPKKAVIPNVFDDSKDIFTPKGRDPSVERQKEVSPKLEDDIFMPPPLPVVSEKTKTRNLFDDDDEDDDFENIFAKKPSGNNKFTQQTKNLFEDDLEDLPVEPQEKSLTSEKEKCSEAIKVPMVREAIVKDVPLTRKGLFDDDDDGDFEKEDDIFVRKPVSKDLFEDVFSNTYKKEPVKAVSGLQNDLFSDVEQVVVNKKVIAEAKKKEVPINDLSDDKPGSIEAVAAVKTDLFADVFRDEPPDDIFASSSEKKRTKIADIFADDFTDDFEEFIPKVSTTKADDVVASRIESYFPDPSMTAAKPNFIEKLPEIAQKPMLPKIDSMNHEIISAAENVKQPAEVVVIEKLGKEDVSSNLSADFAADMGKIDSTPSSLSRGMIFEDENLPTVTSQAPESTNITPEAEKQLTVTVPSYTSLFQDEPPPDDEDLIIPSYDEPPKCSADEDEIVATPPVAPYSSMNLFADVPPDDDFPIAPTETKRIHSIFYDDFHETIEATKDMRAPSTYIFNEEPPPDDDLHSPKVVAEDKPKIVEEKKDKPKVSKLKKIDLQINVGALLPTAKLPSFRKPDLASETVSIPPRDDDVSGNIPIVKPSEKRDIPENILPNLNRDRAKVLVKRRPSTRKGRQASYRKSMIEDEIGAAEQEQDDDDDDQTGKTLTKSTSLFEDVGTFDIKKSTLSEISSKEEVFKGTTSIKREPKWSPVIEKSDISVENSDKTKNDSLPSDSVGKSTSLTSSSVKIQSVVEESGSDAGNIFETLRSKDEKQITTETKSSSVVTISDSLFDSDGVDENPFGSPTKSLVESILTKVQSLEETEVTSKPKASAAIFNDLVLAEEKSSLDVQPPKSAFKPLQTVKEPTKQSSKSSSLFGESDDGSDDLFKEIAVPKKPAQQKINEKKLESKPLRQPSKAAASLFSSDEESGSGDDIFGKSKTKVATKKVGIVKTKPSSSLFADLSDDDADDLFGTAKKKSSAVEKPKSKASASSVQTTKTPATAQQQTATSNNPLSDLLGP